MPLDLAAIRARVDAYQSGPPTRVSISGKRPRAPGDNRRSEIGHVTDFLAHAAADLRALCDEVEALRSRLAAAEGERDAAIARADRLAETESALRALVGRWDLVAGQVHSAEQIAWLHGWRLPDGAPTLVAPLAEARRVLEAADRAAGGDHE